ncbi:MAG: hypothetical protein ACREQ5_33490 [Candidatus Dormibacteria bacterium]
MSAEATTGAPARSRVLDELLAAAYASVQLISATDQLVPFVGPSASDRRSAGSMKGVVPPFCKSEGA